MTICKTSRLIEAPFLLACPKVLAPQSKPAWAENRAVWGDHHSM